MDSHNDRTDYGSFPFMVYAADEPINLTTVATLLGYGEQDAGTISGCAMVISGGHLRMGTSPGTEPVCMLAGVAGENYPLDIAVVQSTVGMLAPPEDAATIVYCTRKSSRPDWVADARKAGCRVTEMSGYALCECECRHLREFKWLDGVVDNDPITVLCSPQPGSPLQRALSMAASANEDFVAILGRLLAGENGLSPSRYLQECRLLAALGGPDGANAILLLPDSHISQVSSVLKDVAGNLGVILYDADSLSESDDCGNRFAEFAHWLEWFAVPKRWARVA